MIECRAASLVYGDHGRTVYACRDISLEIREREFVGILGPSGSGKSSLLYLLSGLKRPTSGEIRLDGRDIAAMGDDERSRLRLREFGFVFQQPYLLGYLSARENAVIGAGKKPSAEAYRQADELLERLGIGDKADRLPHEMSGGERQRVCVARALIGKPRAIFADEPTAALDHTNGVQVVQLLNEHRGEGALIMVTHDPSMLVGSDRILQIADGQVEMEKSPSASVNGGI
jgi:putative ABC transport system ATP-binding protein